MMSAHLKRYSIEIYLLLLFLLLTCLSTSAQQYQESESATYSLPPVLKLNNNQPVKTRQEWEERRRPEILHLFKDNVYGQLPDDYDSIRYTLVNGNSQAMQGRADLKEVRISIYRGGQQTAILLTLFMPKQRRAAVPVFLLINNRPKENTDPSRKIKSGFWPAEMVIDSGYAIAAFHVSDLAPDNKDSFQNGVLKLYPEQLEKADGMRAIGAWAWGASRIMDYLEQDSSILSNKVALVGHSRGGKASLWAAANDPRFAICISNCSGNTGAALSRRKYGERISNINQSFPHWFTPNYKNFNNKEDSLPIDQHMLISLVAPRGVYVTNASKDLWADPKGSFLSIKNAEEVYRLYGLNSALPPLMPAINKAITLPPMGYHNREGIHDLTPFDWQRFILFSRSYF